MNACDDIMAQRFQLPQTNSALVLVPLGVGPNNTLQDGAPLRMGLCLT